MQVGSPRASLSPTTLGYYPSLGSALLRGRRVCRQAGRAGGCAAGSVLGSRTLTGALCLGLAAWHLRNLSKQKLCDICNGE